MDRPDGTADSRETAKSKETPNSEQTVSYTGQKATVGETVRTRDNTALPKPTNNFGPTETALHKHDEI